MCRTYQLWRWLNTPIHASHPFHYLSILKSPPPIKRKQPQYQQFLMGAIAIFCCWLFITGQFNTLAIIISVILYLAVSLVVMILFIIIASCGVYLAGKITNRLNYLQRWGIYDMLCISPSGGEHAIWHMGRLIYLNSRFIIFIRDALTVGTILLVGLFILLGQLGAISLIGVYMWFAQGVIMGHLVAIWSFHLRTDGTNRVFAGVSMFIGWQLVLSISALVLVSRALYGVSMRMGWHTSMMVLVVQLIGFGILIEIMVRVMMRLAVHQSGLSYA
ncbi:MAG: hypothetical protein CUN52_14435, partial [Phototrophicales bacterium]